MESAPRDQASGSFTLGTAISRVVAVWACSEMFRTIMTGLKAMYAVEERRPFRRWALISVLLALVVAGLLTRALVLLVFGARIGERVADVAGMGAVFMAYVYASSFILLLGAEMNQVIEVHHPAGTNEGERHPAES